MGMGQGSQVHLEVISLKERFNKKDASVSVTAVTFTTVLFQAGSSNIADRGGYVWWDWVRGHKFISLKSQDFTERSKVDVSMFAAAVTVTTVLFLAGSSNIADRT